MPTTVATVLVGVMSASDRLRQCAVQSVWVLGSGSGSSYSSRAETSLERELPVLNRKTTNDLSFFQCLYLYFPLPAAIFHSRSLQLQSDVSIFLEPNNSRQASATTLPITVLGFLIFDAQGACVCNERVRRRQNILKPYWEGTTDVGDVSLRGDSRISNFKLAQGLKDGFGLSAVMAALSSLHN